MLFHVYDLSQDSYIKNVVFEWKAPFDPSVKGTRIFDVYMILLASILFCFILGFRNLSLRGFFLIFCFGFLSLSAQRHIAVLAIASVLPMAEMLKNRFDTNKYRLLRYGLLYSFLISVIVFCFLKGNVVSVKPGVYYRARIPEQTINYLKEKSISGNVLNTYPLGGQLIYYFYPQIKIVIDSRIDAYGSKYMEFYRELWSNGYNEFDNFLDKYKVNHIIVHNQMLYHLKRTNRFKEMIEDGWLVVHWNHRVHLFSKL